MQPWLAAIATLFFPGFAQGLTYRRARMALWAVGCLMPVFAMIWTVWAMLVMFVLRIAGAIDGYRCAERDRGTTSNRRLAVIAIVIAAVGTGSAQLVFTAYKIPSSSMAPTLVIGDHVYVDKLSLHWRAIAHGDVIAFHNPCDGKTMIKRVIAVGGDTVEVRCGIPIVNGTPIAEVRISGSCRYEDELEGHVEYRVCSRYRGTSGDHTYDIFHDPDRPNGPLTADWRDFPRDGSVASCADDEGVTYRGAAWPQPVGEVAGTPNPHAPCAPQRHLVMPAGALFVLGDNRDNSLDSRIFGLISRRDVVGRVSGIWWSKDLDGSLKRAGGVE